MCQNLARHLQSISWEREAFLDGGKNARAARVHGPGADFADRQSELLQPPDEPWAKVGGNQAWHPRRERHLETVVADVPGHGVFRVWEQARSRSLHLPRT